MAGLVKGKRGRARPRIFLIDNIVMWIGLMGPDLMNAVGLHVGYVTVKAGQHWFIHVGNRRDTTTTAI